MRCEERRAHSSVLQLQRQCHPGWWWLAALAARGARLRLAPISSCVRVRAPIHMCPRVLAGVVRTPLPYCVASRRSARTLRAATSSAARHALRLSHPSLLFKWGQLKFALRQVHE